MDLHSVARRSTSDCKLAENADAPGFPQNQIKDIIDKGQSREGIGIYLRPPRYPTDGKSQGSKASSMVPGALVAFRMAGPECPER